MSESALPGIGANLLISKYQRLLDHARRQEPAIPANLAGRGILICAGNPRLFTCAWVLIHQLREVLRCSLPIQVWYAGPRDLDERMLALFHGIEGLQAVDATRISGYERIQSHHGWALKPFAILHSSFREVLLLDADNLAVVNPDFLFDEQNYVQTGAIFWPDLNPVSQESPIWEVTRVPYREEPAFESGQILIDKSRCWKALALTMYLNENAQFYYRIIHGDKDTFHFAWHMTGQAYAMPAQRPDVLHVTPTPELKDPGPILLQSDFGGRVIFQHRNWPKWTAYGKNPSFPGALYEPECNRFLSRLEALWDGKMTKPALPPRETYAQSPAGTRWFHYILVGIGDRPMEFLPDGNIGHGAM